MKFIVYSFQVVEDLISIWDWVLNEKLGICEADRIKFAAILVLPETFDSRGTVLISS